MEVIKRCFSKNNNEIILINQKGTKNSKKVLVIGVVHGEEPQGKFLINEYLKSVSTSKNNMYYIPCLNPDGMMQNQRQNANGVDLNRNFETKNWVMQYEGSQYFGGLSPASEVETCFVSEIIEELSPDVILTLHAPFKVVNYDGPAKELAEKISEIIGYPVQGDIGYPTPGSFGTYCGVERNIPIITLELDEDISVESLCEPVFAIFDLMSNF